MNSEVFAACREFHLSHGEAAHSRLLKLAPEGVNAIAWSNEQYRLYLDAVNADAYRGLEPCERCGKRDLLTRLMVKVREQTHDSPAEYEELSLCMTCVPDDSNPRERGDEDGPPDADHEFTNTARERDERAWDEKRSLR